MKFELIDSETHTSEYLLHKYWARKPHNVISHLIKTLLPNGGKLLDPCCGSGVSLREAAKLGIDATGIDLNPIACLISSVLLSPPNLKDFEDSVLPIITEIERLTKPFYCDGKGNVIKYLIHTVDVRCNCGRILNAITAKKEGNRYRCPDCGAQLNFNLESLVDTTVTGYCTDDGIHTDTDTVLSQKACSDKLVLGNDVSAYVTKFHENRRILAFDGMTTASLFTKRNFSILAKMADCFNEITDSRVKNAALLLLTATSAQCSRLIPSRNNLTTGGPSWSIPGFWVPKEHLETNPIVHIKARYKKFVKGLESLIASPVHAQTQVLRANSLTELHKEKYASAYDLVFLDPPYGDSIPYLEFSTFWNSFLKSTPDVAQDISVSDRSDKRNAWKKYEDDLVSLVVLCKKSLKTDGRILVTFNNNDLRAWACLLKALQSNGYKCEYSAYQIPAVVSSKAQKAKDTSYISDFYSVYVQNASAPSKDLTVIINRLKYAASVRGGTISENICKRIALAQWLSHNVDYALIQDLPTIIDTLFDKNDKTLTLKQEYLSDDMSLKEMCRKKASDILESGPMNVNALLLTVCNGLYEFGMPDPTEVKKYLQDYPVKKNRYLGAIMPEAHESYVQLRLPID